MWKVVSGEDYGGILVRQDRHLASPLLPHRLSFGAWVRETSVVGGRLCYTLVEGDGPETGWVTLVLNHKKLLVRDTLIRDISESRWLGLLRSMQPRCSAETLLDGLLCRSGCGCGAHLCNVAGLGRLTSWPIAVQHEAGPPKVCDESCAPCAVQLSPPNDSEAMLPSPSKCMALDDSDDDNEWVEGHSLDSIELEYAALDASAMDAMQLPNYNTIELEYAALSVSDADHQAKLINSIRSRCDRGLAPLIIEQPAGKEKSKWGKLLCDRYRQSSIKAKIEEYAKAIEASSSSHTPSAPELSPLKSFKDLRHMTIEESSAAHHSDAPSAYELSPRKLFKEFKSHGGA